MFVVWLRLTEARRGIAHPQIPNLAIKYLKGTCKSSGVAGVPDYLLIDGLLARLEPYWDMTAI